MRVSEPYTIFPRKLKSGKIVYYEQHRLDNGTRSVPKSTGCTTESSAKRYCNKLYNQGAFETHSSLRFSVFTKDFFAKDKEFYKWKSINNANITDETLLAYDKFLRNQLMPYFANVQISAITRAEIKNWIIWASSKWSAKTVNNAQTVLNAILNQAVDKEIIQFNPTANISFRKIDKKKRVILTIEEVKKTYKSDLWTNEILRTAFLVLAITGMRISEVVALCNEDITDDYINVRHSYSRQFGLGFTKTKECRYVPKPKDFVLKAESGEWIFPAENGLPFNICRMYDNLQRIWKSLGIDSKERGLTTHTMRHFFNSYLLKENVPKSKVKAVMGHKDKDDMTDWYAHWTPDMFPEVYDAQLRLYNKIKE